jgi:archaellum component FlaC
MPNQRKYEDIFGHALPYVRIKDYIFKRDEILKLTLESRDFLPTITLHVSSMTKSLSRENMPVDGDRVSVGIRQDKVVFKPIASDFIITSITAAPHKDNAVKKGYYEYLITAKLFIPNLDTGLASFAYTGFAEDALRDAAIRLGLGYVHTKNTKTLKEETWHCYSDPLEYITEVTKHMWLGKDSFFDSWIDARRNLTVVNVNDLLGRKLSDDGELDFTKYKSISGSIGEDGKYVNNDLADLQKSKFPKMFCNDPQFENSMWYPIEYQYVNNSTNVSKNIGVQRNFEVYVQNNGVGQSEAEARHQIDIGVWYMQEKLDLGYVIANGPTNYAKDFKMASNGSWKDQNTKTYAPILMPIESDSDVAVKKKDQSNLNVSGNFSKEYVIAPEHNKINLAELDKQEVIVTTYGANLGILKGEKVPCFLYNRSNEKWVSETRNTQDTGFEFDMVCSGWFYVKAVELIYEPDFKSDNFVTDWKTRVTLSRREWFPPESTATKKQAEQYGILAVDVAKGSTVESVSDPTTSSGDESGGESGQSSSEDSMYDTIELAPKAGDFIDAVTEEISEFSAMAEEAKANLEDFELTKSSSAIVNSVSSLLDSISAQKGLVSGLTGSMANISLEEISLANFESSSIEKSIYSVNDGIKSTMSTLSSAENTVNGILASSEYTQALNSIKNGVPLGEDIIVSLQEKIETCMGSVSSVTSSIEKASGQIEGICSSLPEKLSEMSTKAMTSLKSEVSSKIKDVKSTVENAASSAKDIVSSVVDKVEAEAEAVTDGWVDTSLGTGDDPDFDAMMAYDGDGMKHFMNVFISTLNSESIPYKALGKRRWAVDKEDKKVYGNAFCQRETSELYKTLDSDGKLYWLGDFNSRHYYGEAVDIEPTSTFDDLLEKICLSEKVLDCMHKYGISLQLEVSKSGHSKGTHFHCSTDRNNPQSKWWGIVNKRRLASDLTPYAVILKRDYYEEETKNEIQIA